MDEWQAGTRTWEPPASETERSESSASGPKEPEEVSSMDHTGAPEGSMPSFLKDDVAPILAAAERAAAQIVERAKEQARSETEDLERSRQRVEARIAELAAWQARVEPSIRVLQSKVADIQSKIEEVPELIRKALDPVATAISSLDPTLTEVASASSPVLSMEPLNSEMAAGPDTAEN